MKLATVFNRKGTQALRNKDGPVVFPVFRWWLRLDYDEGWVIHLFAFCSATTEDYRFQTYQGVIAFGWVMAPSSSSRRPLGCFTCWRRNDRRLELSHILRSVNMRIRLSQDGVYKAEVVWARCGRSGVVLEDTAGYWKDMPGKIEAAVYDGLSQDDMDRMQAEPPEMFPSPVEAIRWAMDQVDADGQPVFKDEAHAQNAYEKVRREVNPRSACEMRDAWVEEVIQRKEWLEETSDIAA